MRGRFLKASMCASGKARVVPSMLIPIVSRRNMAGSSDRMVLITSILPASSHRGRVCIRCVHLSGKSVLRQASQTSENWNVLKSGFPFGVLCSRKRV